MNEVSRIAAKVADDINAEIKAVNSDWAALTARTKVLKAKIASAETAVKLRLDDLEAVEMEWVAKHPLTSVIIVAALQHLWSALAFVLVMFVIGVYTTSKRVRVTACWPWVSVAMAAGILPVLLIVYATGTAPLNGLSLIPIAGIVIGNMMTAHTLGARNSFTHLRSHLGEYEAGLSLGFSRAESIRLTDPDSARDATMPNNDQTRTVGLVTLPGAFIGVLLGGGSPVQAGAAQVLVLLGIMAGQAATVTVGHRFIEHARIVTSDLRLALHP